MPYRRTGWAGWACALGLLAAAGCATPPAPRPMPPRLSAAALGLTEGADAAAAQSAAWWRAYGNAGLDEAVRLALAGHPTMAVAQARIAQALAAVAGAEAAITPRWEPGADLTVQRFSEHGPVPPSVAGATRVLAQAQLAMQWEIDLFGRLRTELAAAQGQVAAAEQEQRAAQAALAHGVVQAWIDRADAQARAAGLQQESALLDALLALQRQRVAAGLDDERALRQAEAERAALRERLAAANGARARAGRLLDVLTGQGVQGAGHGVNAERGPRDQAAAPDVSSLPAGPDAPSLPAAPQVPPLLDSGLLIRRGDVQAARWRIDVAVQDLAATRALYMPSVNLHAVVGLSAIGLGRFIDLGSRQIGAGPALRLPLFDVPRLKALVRGREAELEAAVAVYNERVLGAVQESSLALAGLQAARQRLRAQQAVQAESAAALALVQQREAAGLVSRADLLRAQQALRQQQSQVEERQAQALREHANLMRALGGSP